MGSLAEIMLGSQLMRAASKRTPPQSKVVRDPKGCWKLIPAPKEPKYTDGRSCALKKGPKPLPCFDLNAVTIERAQKCSEPDMTAFFYKYYWGREPSTAGVLLSTESPYIQYLTNKFVNFGDRILAFDSEKRSKRRQLVGIVVGEKTFPWKADQLEEDGNFMESQCLQAESDHMKFMANVLKKSNLFDRYNVPFVYDILALGTLPSLSGHGLGTLLMRCAIIHAMEMRYPLIQVLATSKYVAKICEHLKMKREWSISYDMVRDYRGRRVFFPRPPHFNVTVYSMKLDITKRLIPDSCDPDMFKTYMMLLGVNRPKPDYPAKPTCYKGRNEYNYPPSR